MNFKEAFKLMKAGEKGKTSIMGRFLVLGCRKRNYYDAV